MSNYPYGFDISIGCIATDVVLALVLLRKHNLLQAFEFSLAAYYHTVEARKPFYQQRYYLYQLCEAIEILAHIETHNMYMQLFVLCVIGYLIQSERRIDYTQTYRNQVFPTTLLDYSTFIVQVSHQVFFLPSQPLKQGILLLNSAAFGTGFYKLIATDAFNHNAIWHIGMILGQFVD